LLSKDLKERIEGVTVVGLFEVADLPHTEGAKHIQLVEPGSLSAIMALISNFTLDRKGRLLSDEVDVEDELLPLLVAQFPKAAEAGDGGLAPIKLTGLVLLSRLDDVHHLSHQLEASVEAVVRSDLILYLGLSVVVAEVKDIVQEDLGGVLNEFLFIKDAVYHGIALLQILPHFISN